jgi:hypothetical protein
MTVILPAFNKDDLLSVEEIKQRLQAFWDSNEQNWSIFDDVPPIQQVSVMYPHRIKPLVYAETNHANKSS